jgi:hypothetical protein
MLDYKLMKKISKKISKKLDKCNTDFCMVILADLLCEAAVDGGFNEREFIRCMRKAYRLYCDGSEL